MQTIVNSYLIYIIACSVRGYVCESCCSSSSDSNIAFVAREIYRESGTFDVRDPTVFTCPSWLSERTDRRRRFLIFLWKWICSSRGISQLSNGKTSFHGWLSTPSLSPRVLEIDTRAIDRRLARFLPFETRERRLRRRKGTTGWAMSPSGPRFSVHRRCLLCPGRPGTRNLILNTIHEVMIKVMH